MKRHLPIWAEHALIVKVSNEAFCVTAPVKATPAKDANVVFCVVALAKATPTKSTFLVLSEKLEVHLQALQGVGATQS